VYDLLKKFFLDHGHQVESPEYFLMNQLGDKKAKILTAKENNSIKKGFKF
jgi:hypothetical protein